MDCRHGRTRRIALASLVSLSLGTAAWAAGGTALSGKSVTVGPSHGRYQAGSGWAWQRPETCDLGEDILEDLNSMRIARYLKIYLESDGAVVHVPRQMDENDCCHPAENRPWWQMAARYWLEHQGLPAAIWDSSDVDYNDDIRARPLYADHVGSDIYFAIHTNGGGGTGTETYYSTEMAYSGREAASLQLATAVHTAVMNAIHELYNEDWPEHGTGLVDGGIGYGELTIPNQPTALIELAYHDNCELDAMDLVNPYFRSLSAWGMYQGICNYFGVTPTWSAYSCELVGHTLPDEMTAGQSIQATVTVRNRGVFWWGWPVTLDNPGDDDPFNENGYSPEDMVEPGATYTFNIQLNAPTEPGIYTTRWQMELDAPYASNGEPDGLIAADLPWGAFGPLVEKEIIVRSATPTVGWVKQWASYGPLAGNDLNDRLARPCFYTERNIDPSIGNYTNGLPWNLFASVPMGDHEGLDFERLGSTANDLNAYAHSYVYCPSARLVRSLVGSTGAFELFVDGIEIDRGDTPGTGSADEFISDAFVLTKGWHRVMVHTARNTGDWKFMLRFDDGAANILTDLQVTAYRSQLGPATGIANPSDPGARPPCIRDWLVLGTRNQAPFPNGYNYCASRDVLYSNGGGYERDARPWEGKVQASRTWTDVRDSAFTHLGDGANQFDFNSYFTPNEQVIGYLHVYCYNPGLPVSARVSAAFDDGVNVYVNGTRVLQRCSCCGGCDTNISSAFTLNRGDNSILLRVDENYVLWYGALRLIGVTNTQPIEGVSFHPNPSPPTIDSNPVSQVVGNLQTAVLQVQAFGLNMTYRWQKNGQDLFDSILPGPNGTESTASGPQYAGTATNTLTISGADASAAGQYRCVMTSLGGQTTSEEAELLVVLKMESAESLRIHDPSGAKGFGPADLALPLDLEAPTSEPRLGGVQKIRLTFSEPVAVQGGPVSTSDVQVSDDQSAVYTPGSIQLSDNTLELTFDPGVLPNVRLLTLNLGGAFLGGESGLALAGDTNLQIRNLEGDTNNDGRVNLIDLAQTKASYGSYADGEDKAGLDLNLDGVVNLIDLVACRSRYGSILTGGNE